jgi:hypothetical protein
MPEGATLCALIKNLGTVQREGGFRIPQNPDRLTPSSSVWIAASFFRAWPLAA